MKRIIGLTGGIGSGKSTVAAILADEYGAEIVDADKIGHRVIQGSAKDRILSLLGGGILNEEGKIDRGRVAKIVFGDKDKLGKLDSITHPLIEEQVKGQIDASRAGIVVLDAALLIEAGWEHFVDELWVVVCDEKTRTGRIMKRDGRGAEDAVRRIKSQMADGERIVHADVVIDNSRSRGELEKAVRAAMGDRSE